MVGVPAAVKSSGDDVKFDEVAALFFVGKNCILSTVMIFCGNCSVLQYVETVTLHAVDDSVNR